MEELTKEELIDAIFKAAGYRATYKDCVENDENPDEVIVRYIARDIKTLKDLWKDRNNEWEAARERAYRNAGTEIESRYIKVEDLRKLSIGEIADKIAEIDSY